MTRFFLLFFICFDAFAKDLSPRYVVLSPALVEILFALGAEDHIVGATEYANYPEPARKITRVGRYDTPSIEKIISLHPDLVIAASDGVDTYSAQLARAKIKLKIFSTKRLSDFGPTAKFLGALVEKSSAAETLIKNFDENLIKAKALPSNRRVILQIDNQPLTVAGKDNFLTEIITLCGSKNVFENEPGYPRINLEAAIWKKPDVVVATVTNATTKDLEAFWKTKPGLANVQVLTLDPNVFSRLTPRLAEQTPELCKKLRDTQ